MKTENNVSITDMVTAVKADINDSPERFEFHININRTFNAVTPITSITASGKSSTEDEMMDTIARVLAMLKS